MSLCAYIFSSDHTKIIILASIYATRPKSFLCTCIHIKWMGLKMHGKFRLRKKKLKIGELNCLAEYYGVVVVVAGSFFSLPSQYQHKATNQEATLPETITKNIKFKCKYDSRLSLLNATHNEQESGSQQTHTRTHARKSPITRCVYHFSCHID